MDLFSFFIALLNFPILFTNIFGFRLVGLTGGIATGKSTATKYIKNLGIPVIDFDLIAREVVQPGSSCLQQIITEFGADIVYPDGNLNRTKLGSIIFKDASKRKILNQIMQRPIMYRFFWLLLQMFFLGQISSKYTSSHTNTTKDEGPLAASHGITTNGLYPGLEQPFNGTKVIVLDCPLLFESGISNLCTSTVYINCEQDIQTKRLMARDGIGENEAENKIKSQWGVEKKIKMVKNVITNNTTEQELYTNISSWWIKMTKNEFGFTLTKPKDDFNSKMGPLLALQRQTQEDWTKYVKDTEAYNKQQNGLQIENKLLKNKQDKKQDKKGKQDQDQYQDQKDQQNIKNNNDITVGAQNLTATTLNDQQNPQQPLIQPNLPPKYDKTKLYPRVTDVLDMKTQPTFWETYSPFNFSIKPTLLSLLFTTLLAIPSFFIIQWIEHSFLGSSSPSFSAVAATNRNALNQVIDGMSKPPK